MAFELLCVTLIALLFGMAVTFGGYRLFITLLPIWGFLFGFGLGAQTLQALFGYGFLTTATSWVVGFIVGALFSVLSYLFFLFAVALLASSVGYGLGVSIMLWIGFGYGLLTWMVGVVAGLILIIITLGFNLQKLMIIIETAIIGAGILIGTMMLGAGGLALTSIIENPIGRMLQDSPLWAILYLVLVAAGISTQLKVSALPIDDNRYASGY